MSNPFKVTGWGQELYTQSSSKKEVYGALRFTQDGRAFRYAKAGGTIVAGKQMIMAATSANHIKQTTVGTAAVGAMEINLTVGATAVTANQYQDGYFQLYDTATGTAGLQYLISNHTVCDASGITTVTLAEPIRVAIKATDTFSLIPNPWNGITHGAALANGFAGIAPIAVTSGNYFWAQTGGVVCYLNQGATALGSELCISTTSGALQTAADYTSLIVGQAIGFASITAKYNPAYLYCF